MTRLSQNIAKNGCGDRVRLFAKRNGLPYVCCSRPSRIIRLFLLPDPRYGRVGEFIHLVDHIVAPAIPKHLAEVRQRRRCAKKLPLTVFISSPRPGHALAVVPRNPNATVIAKGFIPNHGSPKTIPRGETYRALRKARGVPAAHLRHDVWDHS